MFHFNLLINLILIFFAYIMLMLLKTYLQLPTKSMSFVPIVLIVIFSLFHLSFHITLLIISLFYKMSITKSKKKMSFDIYFLLFLDLIVVVFDLIVSFSNFSILFSSFISSSSFFGSGITSITFATIILSLLSPVK